MALMGLLAKAIGLGAILLITRYVLAYLQSPLKTIPGPFLAKFSDIWRFLNHYGQTHIETQRRLHEQHGDIVRLGPNFSSNQSTYQWDSGDKYQSEIGDFNGDGAVDYRLRDVTTGQFRLNYGPFGAEKTFTWDNSTSYQQCN